MHQVSRIQVHRVFTPAPAPDDSHANIPVDATPAAPPESQSPIDVGEQSVSPKTVEANGEHDIMMHNPSPRSLYQQPLKSSSEPALSTSNPEWELELPRERLAAELGRLRASPRSFRHPFILNQDDLLVCSTLEGAMYDGDVAFGGVALLPGGSGGGGGYTIPLNRSTGSRARNGSRATVQTRVHASAPEVPARGVIGTSQDHRVSFEDMEPTIEHPHEDTSIASEIVEAPRAHGVPLKSTRWDQNIKKNPCSRWLWLVLPDLCLLFAAFIAVMCLERFLDNFRWMHRTFPMTWDSRTSTWVGSVDISWPKQDFIVPILTAEILIPLIPTIILAAMQIWVRSFWDFNAAFFGLFKGIAIVYVASYTLLKFIEHCRQLSFGLEPPLYIGFTANKHHRTLLQVLLKSFIGEFRPHFMSVCNPHGGQFGFAGSRSAIRFASVYECPAIQSAIKWHGKRAPLGANDGPIPDHWTIDETAEYKTLRFAMQSFPSGHTMEAFYVGTFLALYLNAKLKACSDYHTSLWKLMVVLCPIVGAAFIAASVAVDHNHHFHDVVLSMPIGVLIGLLAYRTHYVSIFNYRTNHLYLPWSSLHRSTNLTAPTVPIARDAKPGYRFKSKYRHKTAVAWPRRPETQGWDRGQETGTVGLDGTEDGKSGRTRRGRLPRTVRKGTMRQSMFPVKRARSNDAVGSKDNIPPMTDGPPLMTPATRTAGYSTPRGPPNGAATSHVLDSPGTDIATAMNLAIGAAKCSTPPRTPNSAAMSRYLGSPGRDVAPAATPNLGSPGRVAVDDWVCGGRPSDMV